MKIKRKKILNRRLFIKKMSGLTAGSFLLSPILFQKLKLNAKPKPVSPNLKPDPSKWSDNDINVAWIGHATVLLNFYGTIILTDPVLFERIGVYLFGMTIGPARYTAPALEINQIPQPDIVLLSHAHMDHMDYRTLMKLTKMYPNKIDCVTAFNTKDIISEFKWKSLQELDWDEDLFIGDVNIKALEVKHFGWRFPWEKDRSRGYFEDGRSYNAYVIEKAGKKILFGGDTAYTDSFKKYNLQNVEIAIMPVGAYYPWKVYHCNPEEALIMANDHAKAKHFIPIHCKTFKQGMEPVDEPLNWVKESDSKFNISVGLAAIGQTFKLPAVKQVVNG